MQIDVIATLADNLKAAPSAESYWETCMSAFSALGVGGIGYAIIPMADACDERGMTHAAFFRHTYSREWERAVGTEKLLDEDNTTELLLGGAEEVCWADDSETQFTTLEDHQYLKTLEYDLGMRWGKSLLLSHHSKNRVSSGIGMHVTEVRNETDLAKYWKEYRSRLRMISEILNVGMLGEHTDAMIRLTGREKDYLYWAAMGLNRIEMAERLGISKNTLDKPIASAKAKLKARSTPQAVAKAVSLGVINL